MRWPPKIPDISWYFLIFPDINFDEWVTGKSSKFAQQQTPPTHIVLKTNIIGRESYPTRWRWWWWWRDIHAGLGRGGAAGGIGKGFNFPQWAHAFTNLSLAMNLDSVVGSGLYASRHKSLSLWLLLPPSNYSNETFLLDGFKYGRPGQHKLVGGMKLKIAFASKFKKKERKCVPAGYRTRALSRFLTSKCRKFCEANVITTTPRKRVSSRGHEGHPFLLLRSTHSTDALWMPFTH